MHGMNDKNFTTYEIVFQGIVTSIFFVALILAMR